MDAKRFYSLCLILLGMLVVCIFSRRLPFEYFQTSESLTRISFLSKFEAQNIFSSDAFDYHKKFCYAESVARTKHREMPREDYINKTHDVYLDACLDFSDAEKNTMSVFIRRELLLRGLNWRFIKMMDNMDFSFPYTLSDIIVLPQIFVSTMCEQLSKENTKTLIHEQIHICQRKFPDIFRSYYEDNMGFKSTPDLIIPPQVRKMMITNPDGLDRWVTTETGRPYFYCLILENDYSMNKVAYPVISVIDKDDSTKMSMTIDVAGKQPLSNFKKYHGGVTSCYHPHEIYAYLLSDQICSVKSSI